MKLLHPTACDFIVYKDYKNCFKISLSNMSNHPQDPTPHRFFYCVTIHHDIFLKSLPCEFPYHIFYQFLIINFLINDLLLSKFLQILHTDGSIWTKIMSLYLLMVSLIASPNSSFVFIQFWRGIFNFFANSNSDALFICY